MTFRLLGILLLSAMTLSACATYSASSVSAPDGSGTVTSDRAPTDPAEVVVTKDDIADRPYEVIGDIEVTVNKTTIFNADPTPELVDEELREKAAELGADAVILVRYGTVGVSLISWGSLDGQGRAVYFTE